MRAFVALLLFGIALNASSQFIQGAYIGKVEYFFNNAAVGFGQGISINAPFNTGSTEITAELNVAVLSPGFHLITFRASDTLWSRGWSHPVTRVFFKSWPEQNVAGFRYRIDPKTGEEPWTYQAFPSPSTNAIMNLEMNAGSLDDGVHYLEASAKSANGVWSHISKGTFFSYFAIPSKIKALEYYFEEEGGAAGPLLSVNNFTPSTHLTLDSATFSVPVSNLVNLKKYYVWVRAVDENGNRGLYMKDTITYHTSTTGIRDHILLTPELIVFPNPAADLVNIKLVTLDQPGDLFMKIFDETGRIVSEEKFSFTERDHYSIDVSGLINGVYRITINSSAGRPVARATFVKK
ncbi:MAG TPA: hypothetical protein DDW27_02350 [Bacteroidales bacterium]|nr:hypothetical protein [Bacteroidales bacterium]